MQVSTPMNGLQINRIMHATDFLENSRLALDYAVAFAHHFSALLTLVHAFELPSEAVEAEFIGHHPSVSRVEALNRLDALVSGVRRLGINAAADLQEGEPAPTILQAVRDIQCDLLVLGTHGIYRGLEHFLIGSNAEKVLLSAQCPTLTVGRHVMAGVDLELDFREILIISDLEPEDASLFSAAFQLGRAFGCTVNTFAVGVGDPQAMERQAHARLDHLVKHSSFPSFWWHEIDSVGDSQAAIRRAEKSASSLVITAAHHMGRIDRHLHSSFAFELAARAASPVLSIPVVAKSAS